MRQGLQRFVLETLTSLNHAVGDAWMRGELAVFEEHLYTEQLQVALRTGINAFPRQQGAPRVLLTTFPGEQHGLGLLMVEALLVPEGAQCISLGAQTPIEDIRRAALAHEAHVVALSFSAAFPVRQAGDGLATLRRQLPPTDRHLGGRRDDPPDSEDAARRDADPGHRRRRPPRCRRGARRRARRRRPPRRRGALTAIGRPAAGLSAATRPAPCRRRQRKKVSGISDVLLQLAILVRICHEIGPRERCSMYFLSRFRLPQVLAQVHHSPLSRNEQRCEMG